MYGLGVGGEIASGDPVFHCLFYKGMKVKPSQKEKTNAETHPKMTGVESIEERSNEGIDRRVPALSLLGTSLIRPGCRSSPPDS